MKKILTASFLLLSYIVVAQAPKKVVADKIVAIVGDKIILYSDIANWLLDIQRQGGTLPENAECLLMEQAVLSKVLMLQAEKDSLPLTDEEVEAELDEKISSYINQLSLKEVEVKTIYQIKDEAREALKEQKLGTAMQRKILENVRITPNEVKAFFDKIPADSLPFYGPEMEICQIIIYPESSRELEKYIVGEMNNYKRQLELRTTTFERLARDVSEDQRSSQYQINRKDKTRDPVFVTTVFRLKEGEISEPVKSKYGYYLIQVVKRNGDDAIVRHILRIPPITEIEIKQGMSELDTVRARIIDGTTNFNAAASKYSDDESAKFTGPCIIGRDGSTNVTIDALDKDLVFMLANMKTGDISQPVPYVDEQGKKGVRVVYLKFRSEPHRMNLQDDYSKIAQFALGGKKAKTMEKWMSAKLPTYYVSVDAQTETECPQLKKFTKGQKGF